MDLSPLRLDTLCFDILVEVAHALEVEDLLNLSLVSSLQVTSLYAHRVFSVANHCIQHYAALRFRTIGFDNCPQPSSPSPSTQRRHRKRNRSNKLFKDFVRFEINGLVLQNRPSP
jgi:hypothetical protein